MSGVLPGRLQSLRRRPARLLAASALTVLPLAFAGPAHAASTPSLGGFNVSADGNVVDILVDNATGLAGIHPFTEADFPEAQSQFATGPFGSGLATVFWPGNAGGNFGSLSSELGLPSQLEPTASKLNDPVRASAQYPSGPTSATYPKGAPNGLFDMRSTAGATGVTSTADIADSGAHGVLTFSAAKGTSSSTAGSTARATANSDLTGLSLLGGIIRIGSVQSTATATSDGNTGSGSASTHIAGVTVVGQPASIGSDGLVLPDLSKSLGPVTGPVVQELISQTVSALGLKITEFPATDAQNGPTYTATSGGLAIRLSFPAAAASLLEQLGQAIAPLFPPQAAIVPTLPGILQGMTVTVTLGRATASASASPPFSDSFNPAGFSGGDSAAGGGSGSVVGSGTGSAVAAGATASPGQSGSTSPALATAGATAGTAVPGTGSSSGNASQGSGASLPATLVSLSSPLGAGVVVIGVLVAAALGYGLWRVARLLLAQDAGSVCPLGQDNQ